MTHYEAEDIYVIHIDEPYGKIFANVVGNFQEGFLRDKVCRDVDAAFARAVETALKMLPVIKAKADNNFRRN